MCLGKIGKGRLVASLSIPIGSIYPKEIKCVSLRTFYALLYMINGKALGMYLHLLVLFSNLCIYIKRKKEKEGWFFGGGGGCFDINSDQLDQFHSDFSK